MAADDSTKPAPIVSSEPKGMPAIPYLDEKGASQRLDASKHKLTILHFWATWCGPCVVELPELDKVAAAYKDKGLEVVPLALDGGNMQKIRDFYAAHHITHLSANYDESNTALRAVKAKGLPFTVFINSKGQEIARAKGWIEWDTKASKDFLAKALK